MNIRGKEVFYSDGERLYSTTELEEREFGWMTSKVTRPMKAAIGRKRRDLADKITNSAMKDVKAHKNVVQKLLDPSKKSITSKDVRNNLLKHEAPRVNSTVSYKANRISSQGGGGATITNNSNTKNAVNNPYIPKGDRKLINKVVNKGKNFWNSYG